MCAGLGNCGYLSAHMLNNLSRNVCSHMVVINVLEEIHNLIILKMCYSFYLMENNTQTFRTLSFGSKFKTVCLTNFNSSSCARS